MRNDFMTYPYIFDKTVEKSVAEINEKFKEEMEKDNPDKDAIMKLRLQRLYKGMEMNTSFGMRYNGIPW